MAQGPEDHVQAGIDQFDPDADDFPAPNLPSGYFDGRDLPDLPDRERRAFDIHRDDDAPLHRHSYLYSVEFPTKGGGKDRGDSETGTIELRARTWTHRPDLPRAYRQAVEGAAHKAATLFNSTIETPAYGGYLDGFFDDIAHPNPGRGRWEDVERWEDADQRNAYDDAEAAPGKVDWNVEIYDEDDRLGGIAQGLAFPWRVTEEYEEGEMPVHVSPHKWNISFNDSLGKYDVHPPGNKSARRRYQPGGAGHGKVVRINEMPVGRLDSEGRTWLFPDYANGDTTTAKGGLKQYDRNAIIEQTDATPQALAKGGTLYMTGETETHIDLVTAREKPPGYKPADPDDVSETLQVRPGRDGRTITVLDIVDREESVGLRCERDEIITAFLGRSSPEYRHEVAREWSI